MFRSIQRLSVALLVVLALQGCSEPTESTATPESAIKSRSHVEIIRLKQGWSPVGFSVQAGDELTFAASGEVDIGLEYPLEPRHALWGRIGERGTIFQFPANHHSIISQDSGQVFVAASPSGLLWANRQGDWLPLIEQVPDAELSISVETIAWTGTAHEGLLATQAASDPELASLSTDALAAIDNRNVLPEGFEYMWNMSSANIFSIFTEDAKQGVRAFTNDDFGIIRIPVDLPLTADSRIQFDWRYQSLPALASETSAASHDYMSIAVEFDNGRDITWMWSRDLAPQTHFECPLPEWVGREWHIVLQEGVAGLGQWYSHDRPILADYTMTVPGESPARITGVWIIANAVFGRQQAEAYFANIVIQDQSNRVKVL